MLRLRKTSQTAALRRSSTDAVRSPVSPRTPGKSAGDCLKNELLADTASANSYDTFTARGRGFMCLSLRHWAHLDANPAVDP